jgi:DNA mismatch repair protein MutS
MPGGVISHARHVLELLEANQAINTAQVDLFAPLPPTKAREPSRLEAALAQTDPDILSPREALDVLYALKKLLDTTVDNY